MTYTFIEETYHISVLNVILISSLNLLQKRLKSCTICVRMKKTVQQRNICQDMHTRNCIEIYDS